MNTKFSEPVDIATELGVPVTQRGQPNIADYQPRRFISLEEARAREWSRYWNGEACRYGHQASRATSNIHDCSDCKRERNGKPTVYPKSKAQEFYVRKPKEAIAPAAPAPLVLQAPSAPEPDATDQKFLTALADVRSFAEASRIAGTSIAQIQSRISCNKVFKDAVTDLCDRLQIQYPVAVAGDRTWTQDEYVTFCRAYVDSGSLSRARAAVGVTPSQMHDELDRSPEFRSMFDEAAPKAALALDDIAVDLSLAGNDKLLSKTLPAKLREEYSERVRVDMRVGYEHLTAEQIHERLEQALKSLMELSPQMLPKIPAELGEIHDAEFTDTDTDDAQCDVQSADLRAETGTSLAGGASAEARERDRGNRSGNQEPDGTHSNGDNSDLL